MNLHVDVLALHFGVDHKAGAVAESVQELHATMIAKFSPLSRVRDALEELLCFFGCDGGAEEVLRLTIQDHHWRFADTQLQPIRPIGMEKMQQGIHRIHTFEIRCQ